MAIEILQNQRSLLEQRQKINANFADLDTRVLAIEQRLNGSGGGGGGGGTPDPEEPGDGGEF